MCKLEKSHLFVVEVCIASRDINFPGDNIIHVDCKDVLHVHV